MVNLGGSRLKSGEVHLNLVHHTGAGDHKQALSSTGTPLAHSTCALTHFLSFSVYHMVDFIYACHGIKSLTDKRLECLINTDFKLSAEPCGIAYSDDLQSPDALIQTTVNDLNWLIFFQSAFFLFVLSLNKIFNLFGAKKLAWPLILFGLTATYC